MLFGATICKFAWVCVFCSPGWCPFESRSWLAGRMWVRLTQWWLLSLLCHQSYGSLIRQQSKWTRACPLRYLQDNRIHTQSFLSISFSFNVLYWRNKKRLHLHWWCSHSITVQWRKTSFTVSASIFLCVQSFCSHHLKYMQIILYMQIYAKWHQICKRIRYFFSLFIQFLSFICLVLFECLQITLSCARQLGFTFKSNDAQTYIVTV